MNTKEQTILKICREKLNYLNYAENTIKCYLSYIQQFLDKQEKNYQHLNAEDFTNYLQNYKFTSISQQNQVINAIKFFVDFPRKNSLKIKKMCWIERKKITNRLQRSVFKI